MNTLTSLLSMFKHVSDGHVERNHRSIRITFTRHHKMDEKIILRMMTDDSFLYFKVSDRNVITFIFNNKVNHSI